MDQSTKTPMKPKRKIYLNLQDKHKIYAKNLKRKI